MPRGLKETSSQIVVSFDLIESAANTFTTERIDLQLNALDNEVFVVTGVKMDLDICDANNASGNVRSKTFATLSKQDISNSNVKSLGNPSVFASATIQSSSDVSPQPGGDNFGVAYVVIENSTDAPEQVEYLDIIATPDFYVNLQGTSNVNAKTMAGKMYGYRARADASTYAALVQSELLSQ
tara:strand:+ start:79 stop:624 length:546 start_codon:yes stop_codon:yes gene_type:complete